MWLYMFGFRLHNSYCRACMQLAEFSRGISTFGAIFHVSAVTPVAVTYHVSLQEFVPHLVSR